MYGKDKLHEIFLEYYLVKVNKFDDIAKDTLDEWIYFLKNEEIKGDFKAKGIERAKQELDILKLSDEERRAYERYQDDLHYQASMVESSYTIGVKKGENRKALQIALNLIQKGVLDAQEIAELTELPVEEIEKMITSKEP